MMTVYAGLLFGFGFSAGVALCMPFIVGAFIGSWVIADAVHEAWGGGS